MIPQYKTIKLTGEYRHAILNYARTKLEHPELEQAEDAARQTPYNAVRLAVESRVSAAEIMVLRNYGHTTHALCVPYSVEKDQYSLSLAPRDVRQPPEREDSFGRRFRKRPGDDADAKRYGVEVPSSWTRDVGSQTEIESPKILEAVVDRARELHEAQRAVDTAREAVIAALRSVVYAKKTLQDVAAVWPQATDLAEQFNGIQLESEATLAVVQAAGFGGAVRPVATEVKRGEAARGPGYSDLISNFPDPEKIKSVPLRSPGK